MADNLYALLQQAQEVATTGAAKVFGVEIAIVTNVKDPQKQGRVKICLPRLPGKPETDWARVCQPAAGPGRGFYWLPHVHDEVLVVFERGEAHRPYVLGAVWNGKDQPMKDAYTDENTTAMLQTKSGHQIILDDAKDAEKIVIGDKSGKRTVTFDVKNAKFLIEAVEGDLELHAAKKIVFQCEDLEVKATKKGKVEIGTKFDLTVKGKGQIKAGPVLNLKASKVNINDPGGGGGGGGAGAAAARAAAAAAKAAVTAAASKTAKGPGAAGGAGGGGAMGGGGGAAALPSVNGRRGSPDLSSDVVSPGAGGAGAGGAGKNANGAGANAGGGAGSNDAGAGANGSNANGAGAGANGAGANGANTNGAGAAEAKPVAPPRPNDVVAKVADKDGNPVPDLPYELTLPDGTVKKGKTGPGGEIEERGLSQGGDFKVVFPTLDKGSGKAEDKPGEKGGEARPAETPPDSADQLPAGMLGAAVFAGIVPGKLTADEEAFILSLAKKNSSADQHLRLVRLVYKAYRHLDCSAPVAAGMTSQFVVESDWGRATTGNFNYFGYKGQPGTLCKTTEHNLSAATIEKLTAQDLFIKEETAQDGTRVATIKAWFLDFHNLDDALNRKVQLLKGGGPYQTYTKHKVMESPTPEEFCKRIREAGYATAVNYTSVLISRLKLVDDYAKDKKGKAVEIIQETANAPIDPARFSGGSFG